MHGQGHHASLEADSDTGRAFLLIDGFRAAEIFADYLDCEGEITGLEWLTPPAWLDEALALDLAETLFGLAPGASVEVCEPAPTRSQIERSIGAFLGWPDRAGVAA